MKKIAGIFVALLGMCGNPVWADKGDQYLLGKLGFMNIDLNDADPLFSIGAVYGYGITPAITAEGELNLGLTGGKYKQKNSLGNTYEQGDYRIGTLAGYGTYRYPLTNTAYLKAKLGMLYETIKRNGELQSSDTSSGLGIAGGIGAGTRIGDVMTLEVEITSIDQDILFYSLGLHYAFK